MRQHGTYFYAIVLLIYARTSVLQVRVKMELVSDEPKLKSTIVNIQPINYENETAQILEALSLY